MKLSELIKLFEALEKQHGDIEVVAYTECEDEFGGYTHVKIYPEYITLRTWCGNPIIELDLV